jgi:two-component system, cell cycle sensor histidine kinase and response regulator CckA
MSEHDDRPDADTLRARAERHLHAWVARPGALPTGADAQRLIHELQVHEIELAMQYEELVASRAETEQQRAQYVDLYDFAPTGYLTLDPEGRITQLNLAAASLLGSPRDAVLHEPFDGFVAIADRVTSRACLDRAMAGDARSECEVTLRTPGHAERVVHIEAVLAVSGDDVHMSLADVTERRQAEAALRLRDRALRAVSHGILITDPNQPDNPIIYANAGFEQLTGYRASQVIGRNSRFLHGADTDPATVHVLHDAVRAGQPCSVELLQYTRRGTSYWSALTLTPVHDDAGRLVQYVSVDVDVSERRALELALQQSQRMEAVGRLAGGIAHDFNNLLTVINGYSDVLCTDLPQADPRREFAVEIARAGDRAAVLTRQLLAFSRCQAHDLRVLDVNALVSGTVTMMRRLIGEDVDVRLDVDAEPARVRGDAGQLEQVLMNLALNGRDAMPTGGSLLVRVARVTVDAAYRTAHHDVATLHHAAGRQMPSGDYVVLTVADTGIGMDATTAARVFEPFFTTKDVGKGTGLGLAMVFGVVEASRGYITVDSELGRGSEFSLYFPVAQRDVASDEEATAASRPRGQEVVLLVEDESAVRAFAAHALRTHGYTVLEADSASEALRMAASAPEIALLLSDVVMPGMGGRELADTLRTRASALHVLFMSGYTEDEVVRRGILPDAVPFLQKPLTQDALLQSVRAVRAVLDGR